MPLVKLFDGEITDYGTNDINELDRKRLAQQNMYNSKTPVGDRPVDIDPSSTSVGWGSDAIVQQLMQLDIPYIALVPGSSYRGLHDSIINYAGNSMPEMIVCLHEEHSIAIAHGYAKVTERPMAAAVHANVGLMHATMAIYDAFTDRVPMLILGATGPVDAAKRRPWIDWIHTSADQGALIRHFVKFDDQPASVAAAVKSVVHAVATTSSKPTAPVYVCLDVSLQEQSVNPLETPILNVMKYRSMQPQGPDIGQVKQIQQYLGDAKRPLLLLGRVNRQQSSWNERVKLAEFYKARVITDLRNGCSFPSVHELQPVAPSLHYSTDSLKLIRAADVIIAFDWVDLGGLISLAFPAGTSPTAKIVHCTMDSVLHNGWSQDHFGMAPVDLPVFADPDRVMSALVCDIATMKKTTSTWPSCPDASSVKKPSSSQNGVATMILTKDLAKELYSVIDGLETCFVRLSISWRGEDLQAFHPLNYLGCDGGAGVGSGPGMIVGAALALRGTGRIPIAVLGDGDFLMGATALWTAARYRLPLLVIVANNRSFYNDVKHQETLANMRNRPVENKNIGMSLDDPRPDLSQLSAALGLTVVDSQVTRKTSLAETLKRALKEVQAGHPVVVDVLVHPDDYGVALQNAE